jgi:hypothetical protein
MRTRGKAVQDRVNHLHCHQQPHPSQFILTSTRGRSTSWHAQKYMKHILGSPTLWCSVFLAQPTTLHRERDRNTRKVEHVSEAKLRRDVYAATTSCVSMSS